MSRRILSVFWVMGVMGALLGSHLRAEPLDSFDGKVRAGWEIELIPPQLERVVHYFDFGAAMDRIERGSVSGYLLNPGAFEGLPREVQEELRSGIDPSRILLFPGESEADGYLRKMSERFDQWGLARRAELVDPNRLSREQRATLFYKRPNLVFVRENAPVPVKELLSRLEWVRDLSTVEFRHLEPLNSLAQLERDRSLFGTMAMVSGGFNDLAEVKKGEGVSYHVHASVPGTRDLTSFARAYNVLLGLRLFEGGHRKIFNGEGRNGFSTALALKGVVRLVDPQHIEVRAHPRDPEDTLRELGRFLTQPTRTSLREIKRELSGLARPELLTQLSESASQLHFIYLVGAFRELGVQRDTVLESELMKKAVDRLLSDPGGLPAFERFLEVLEGDPFLEAGLRELRERVPNEFGLPFWKVSTGRRTDRAWEGAAQMLSRHLDQGNTPLARSPRRVRALLREVYRVWKDTSRPSDGLQGLLGRLMALEPASAASIIAELKGPEASSNRRGLFRVLEIHLRGTALAAEIPPEPLELFPSCSSYYRVLF